MLTVASPPMPYSPLLSWNNHNNPTQVDIQSSISLDAFIFLYNIRHGNNRFVCTHAGQMRAVCESGGPFWRVWRQRPHSHSPYLCCRNRREASGYGPSSWSLLLHCLYTSVSSTCPWSPPHNAISVNNSRKRRNNHGAITSPSCSFLCLTFICTSDF